ncbi:MAG: TonB-dependent receptor, partial [Calditrichota bacterium]
RYIGSVVETELATFTNSLKLEQYFGRVQVSAGISYSRARNETPTSYRLDGVEESAFSPGFNFEQPTALGDQRGFLVDGVNGYLHPEEFVNKALNDTSAIFVDWIYDSQSKLLEDELGASFDFQFDTKISNNFNLNWKFGGKYKQKQREFNFESFEHAMWWSTVDVVREDWAARLADSPFLDGYVSTQNVRFPYAPFINSGFDNDRFLAGNFEINRVPSLDMVREFVSSVDRTDQGNAFGLVRNFNSSIPGDYEGSEDYMAAYIMPTLEIGSSLVLIPGIRYEHNETEYGGNRTAALGQWDDPFVYDSVTTKRENDFFLPMLHARYNISEGFDVRASYTQTLSRPSYNLIIPTWQIITPRSLSWNNPDLKPIESDNFDLSFSLYSNKIGLLTIGGFQKTISNFIYNRTTYITDASQILAAYPGNVDVGGQVFGFINNPNDANLWGLEFDWQSNLWFLPGGLNGLVLNVNYTYTDSELEYPMNSPIIEQTIFGGTRIVGSELTPYKAPLLDQPDHLFNLIVGYDYRGFSIRGSMRYKSNVFLQDNFFEELRVFSDGISLFDISLKQDLPFKGLRLYSNTANLSKSIDTNTNRGTNWFQNQEFYGITSEIGLRYDF